MSCVKPLTAYWTSRSRVSITFDRVQSATKVPFNLPCGRCIGCRLEKARQWGIRCLHEAKMWPHNCYVTLTYDRLPEYGSLQLRDVQLFMKRLRKAKPAPLRFFLGGEYGEENYRPHYHALLFNCEFRDRLLFTQNKRGEPLYTSSELTELWGHGHCTIGEVTFDSAVYCAKYALKRLHVNERTSDELRAAYEKRYLMYDEEGVVIFDRCPEFCVMSRRPGIGAGYYERYGSEVVAHDSVVVNGREVRPPRFYDLRSMRFDALQFERHKRARKRSAVLSRLDNTPDRLRVKEIIMERAVEKKERSL